MENRKTESKDTGAALFIPILTLMGTLLLAASFKKYSNTVLIYPLFPVAGLLLMFFGRIRTDEYMPLQAILVLTECALIVLTFSSRIDRFLGRTAGNILFYILAFAPAVINIIMYLRKSRSLKKTAVLTLTDPAFVFAALMLPIIFK